MVKLLFHAMIPDSKFISLSNSIDLKIVTRVVQILPGLIEENLENNGIAQPGI